MDEGNLFFGLMWLGCWYFIFMSDETVEHRRRRWISLLLGICFAGLSVPVYGLHINLFFIAALLWSIYQWRNWGNKELIRGTVAIVCIAIALICIRIYAILYPVWFIVNWIFIAAPLLVGLGLTLLNSAIRISMLTVAIILGETVYSGILYLYGFPINSIGSFESFDLLLLTLTITLVLNKAHSLWSGRMPRRKMYHQHHMGLKGKSIR